MSESEQLNPLEPPRQTAKSRLPIFIATGLAILVMTCSTLAFMAWRATREWFINMPREPFPGWELKQATEQSGETIAVESDANANAAPE